MAERETLGFDEMRAIVDTLLAESPALERPGNGSTRARHDALLEWGRLSLSVGRLMEAHVDAVAILDEAERAPIPGRVYAVWAAERPGTRISLRRCRDGIVIDGRKDFCSGLDICDAALVTAFCDRDPSRPLLIELDLIDLRRAGAIEWSTSGWATPAMSSSRTGRIRLHDAHVPEASIIGEPGWYLDRPGFWNGAIGPAAVWAGGAVALVDDAVARSRRDPHVDAHLGAMTAIRWELAALLAAAADEIDADPLDEGGRARARALAVRHLVDRGAREVIDRYGRALGPGPLATDAVVAGLIADLALSIRQTHAESDLAELGGGDPP